MKSGENGKKKTNLLEFISHLHDVLDSSKPLIGAEVLYVVVHDGDVGSERKNNESGVLSCFGSW